MIRSGYNDPSKYKCWKLFRAALIKIIYNILPHRVLLYKMKTTYSDQCLYCGSQETLQHLLVSCPSLRTFWSDVLTWWNSSSTSNILFDELKILYGYNSGDPRCLLLNYYILTVSDISTRPLAQASVKSVGRVQILDHSPVWRVQFPSLRNYLNIKMKKVFTLHFGKKIL